MHYCSSTDAGILLSIQMIDDGVDNRDKQSSRWVLFRLRGLT